MSARTKRTRYRATPMPWHRYTCPVCGRSFETQLTPTAPPVCTKCGRRMVLQGQESKSA